MNMLDLDAQGRVISPALTDFRRYIQHGVSCIIKLEIEGDSGTGKSVQFSITPEQCRAIAENLWICADVIEMERPTAAQ